jgi:hypothetical protein
MRSKKTEFIQQGDTKMAYRYLGPTGLKVSVLSYGTWLTTDSENEESQNLCN